MRMQRLLKNYINLIPMSLRNTRIQPYSKKTTFVEFSSNQELGEFLKTGTYKQIVHRKLSEEEVNKYIKQLEIPNEDLVIKYSRASGAGGQHVNRTESKATVMFNVYKSSVLNQSAKDSLLANCASRISKNGDLIVSNQDTREQKKNLNLAIKTLKTIIAENITKESIEKIELLSEEPESREKRLAHKKRRSDIKKMRNNKSDYI